MFLHIFPIKTRPCDGIMFQEILFGRTVLSVKLNQHIYSLRQYVSKRYVNRSSKVVGSDLFRALLVTGNNQ